MDDIGQISNDISKMTMTMAKTLKKGTFMDKLESLKNVSKPMQEIREEMDKVTCASKDMRKIVPELEALIADVRMSAVDVTRILRYLKYVRNNIEAEADEYLDFI